MKRYTPSTLLTRRGTPTATMIEHPDGAYVSHAEIVPLLLAAMRLSAALTSAGIRCEFADGALSALNTELEKLL